jgi:predicted MFS family arabinose efflux permease
LNAWSEGGTFFVFGGITVLALIFVYIFIPETKQKSLEEIQRQLID